jgi:histidinol-phosphate aminotransferase
MTMWFVKDEVKRLAAYHLVPHASAVKVNQNENPYDVPAEIKREVLDRFSRTEWCRYPPFVPEALHAALASHYGVDPGWVLAGNGSNEVLYATLAVCLSRGDRIVVPVPTFTLYALLAQVFAAEVRTLPLGAGMTLDADRVIEEARAADAKVLCLCSPNNPTGAQYPRADVERIARSVRALVVLDEAYVEFAPRSLIDLVARHENVAVYRTFSKAMGYAGLRIGAMIARPELVAHVAKGKLPYAINTFTTIAAIVACEKAALLAPVVDRLKADRERLARGMARIAGVHPYPSAANFVLARLDRPVRLVFEALLADGILVRDVSSYPGLEGHIRVSVGTSMEVDRTLAALEHAMTR